MKRKFFHLLFIFTFVPFFLIACSGGGSETSTSTESENTNETPVTNEEEATTSGGTLKIAYEAQPNTLDPSVTTAGATKDLSRPIYESLVTLNENWEVTPQLAESYEISEDGTVVTFKLRQGVLFHNGEEMKAEDVIASMEKWTEYSSLAKSMLSGAEWVEVDEYTVELHLERPSGLVMQTLADQNQVAAIMPKEVAEAADATGAKEYIGTGPFKFEEWQTDQYVKMVRFEDYQPLNDSPSGLAGEKLALVDEIYWYFVPDESTRNAGLISGEYDIATGISYDTVEQIEAVPHLSAYIHPYGFQMLVFNKKSGLFTDVKARQAVNYAVDKQAILQTSFADERFYNMESSLFRPEQTEWYSQVGKEIYDTHDLDLAKQLLEEAGYNGEEVVILTSRDYAYQYNAAVSVQQMLNDVGINAKLDVYDWGTLLDRRSDPEAWDIFLTGWDTSLIPHQYSFLDSEAEWPGWTNSPEIDQILDDMETAATPEEVKELNDKLHEEFWNYMPLVNIGNYSKVTGINEKVKGYQDFIGPVVWNVSVEE